MKRARPDPIERDEAIVSLADETFPIFEVEEGEDGTLRMVSFRGSGFRVADDLFVTCWHCVVDEPERGGFAIARQVEDEYRAHPLLDLARDENGSDLATARIYWEPEHRMPPSQLRIATRGTGSGADVWTYGYPLTTDRVTADQGPRFVLHGRWLEGYIIRAFWYDHPTLGEIPAYELDMPTPEGLSGAPLGLRGSMNVVGVIFGRNDVALVDEFSRVDPETKEATPEIQRILSFGLACDTSTLVALRGPATGGVRLGDLEAATAGTE